MTAADAPHAAALGSDADDLRLRAAVLSHFELPWLGRLTDTEAIDRLLADCDRITGADGIRHWAMVDSAWRDVLRAAGLTRARRAWQALQHRPDTAEQRVINQYLGGTGPVTLSGASAQQVQAAEAVLRWLGVLGAPAPSDWELSSRAGRDAILAPLRALGGSHFTGRVAILARLANDLRYAPGIMLIYGIGGIGKSTIAARHILTAAEAGTAVCYLTFDHASIDPAQPETILAALCRQLATQLDESASRSVSSLAEVASGRRRVRAEKSESPRSAPHGAVESLLQDLAYRLAGRPCLIVLDALEELTASYSPPCPRQCSGSSDSSASMCTGS